MDTADQLSAEALQLIEHLDEATLELYTLGEITAERYQHTAQQISLLQRVMAEILSSLDRTNAAARDLPR